MDLVLTLFYTLWSILCYDPIEIGPSLRFQPKIPSSSNGKSLISFTRGKDGDWKQWAEQLQTFTTSYDQYGRTIQMCNYEFGPTEGKVCYFDMKALGMNCNEENHFGYDTGRPCVAITLDNIPNWTPVPYNKTNIPGDMPEYLKRQALSDYYRNRGLIWLSCEGETAIDRQNIGPLFYTPDAGFPTYFYPYKNQPEYHTPLVMVEFQKPATGVVINIECKAWASNLKHESSASHGRVRFQLLIN